MIDSMKNSHEIYTNHDPRLMVLIIFNLDSI